jgi:hypothetical protein
MLGLWLLRAGALTLAMAGGWLFGRSAPDWRGDSEVVGGGNYGSPGYYDEPLTVGGRGCFAGAGGAVLCWVGALVLAWLGWPATPTETEIFSRGDWEIWLVNARVLYLLPGAVLGYIPSRLTDKGPVGPLE